MSQENVEIVRALFEAYNAADMDAVREFYDPDVIVRTVEDWPEPGPARSQQSKLAIRSGSLDLSSMRDSSAGGSALCAQDPRVTVRGCRREGDLEHVELVQHRPSLGWCYAMPITRYRTPSTSAKMPSTLRSVCSAIRPCSDAPR